MSAQGIGTFIASRFSILFSLDRKKMNTKNCLNYWEARWQCKTQAFCLWETRASLNHAPLSFNAIYITVKVMKLKDLAILLLRLRRTILVAKPSNFNHSSYLTLLSRRKTTLYRVCQSYLEHYKYRIYLCSSRFTFLCSTWNPCIA